MEKYNDYELLSLIQEKSQEATDLIYEKYRPIIWSFALKWHDKAPYIGIEVSDLVQEGLVGLTKAIDHFKDNKDASFYTFAVHCIDKSMNDYCIKANRKKHRILNESLSYDILSDSRELKKAELAKYSDPALMVLSKEDEKNLVEKLREILTDREKQVFELKYKGFTLKEIADKLNIDYKNVDNTIQRIRIKLERVIKKHLNDK